MRSAALIAAPLALSAGKDDAHTELHDPAPRPGQLKAGPCGAGAGDLRGDIVSTFAPGATITVRWRETVPHPGYYRISFDPDGQDAFFDPPVPGETSDDPTILVDNISDKQGTDTYEQQVTLPDAPCDRCTLQLVQVMTDKSPYGDGNDLDYQCADLVLSEDPPATDGTTGAPPDDDTCACRSDSASPAWLGLGLALLLRRRRTRSGASARP